MYPSHKKQIANNHFINDDWIYCALAICDNNKVFLKVNISNNIDPFNPSNYCEYSYQGTANVTRNNIFISLYDTEQQEAINISISRPVHKAHRYIGIISALSPSGQPVAFKCACIGRSLINKVNKNLLWVLLNNGSHEWSDSLMILENQDINLFYSDKILI